MSMEVEQLAIPQAGVPPATIDLTLDSLKQRYPAGGIESEQVHWMTLRLEGR